MRPLRKRTRRGLAGTAAAVAAMTALTASQAPGTPTPPPVAAIDNRPTGNAGWPVTPNDDAYHTELPPLRTPAPPAAPPTGPAPAPVDPSALVRAESGIPATVLAAYRTAEARTGRSDPGCRLPWQLLAAIGKVESGHARGGRVGTTGTTLTPILGPVLDGNGFAHIADTDNGAWDGDRRYDRAVGPMQFIPSTWANWGQDANGDGRRDPNNVHDAALAAARYLCAGDRSLAVKAHLDGAILSYNHSHAYLRTVLAWFDFYRKGVHPVADGKGVVPVSPGTGGKSPAKKPVGGAGGDGGEIIIGPPPGSPAPAPSPAPSPTRVPVPSPDPSPDPSGSPTPSPSQDPVPSPDPSPDPGPDPSDSPAPSPDPGPSDPGPSASDCPAPSSSAPAPEPSASPPGADPGDGPAAAADGACSLS
ncbi:lytic transglycosylase domain-containing protein [Streptomyces sp. NPDC006274]|uniref:lytic transglycosylase domain-containing protein n=1 Tax=unclassified Streptomyces TaxID=2593676 RepID=UPI00339F0C6A